MTLEEKILESARKAIVSDDPKMARRGRFSHDCYVPFLNWLNREYERLRDARFDSLSEEADAIAELQAVYVTAMAMLIANTMPGWLRTQRTAAALRGIFNHDFDRYTKNWSNPDVRTR